MEEKKLMIKEYFERGTFVVPNYQRGYKWAVEDKEGSSSLIVFLDSLIEAFKKGLKEYFIEAVTVVKENGHVILVDGQQRTTTLFLIFVALDDFEFVKNKLKYKVREDSQNWLSNQVSEKKENIIDEDIQDIFYFKKALKDIKGKISEIKKKEFKIFIKENVYLLFNIIPKEKAVNTFIALNGLKAIMKDEELIKSDLLIKSSRIDKEKQTMSYEEEFGIELKISEERGRLARNWDKWLYWWNQKELKKYFGTDGRDRHPLYFLLLTYWNINKNENIETKKFSFDIFKAQFISDTKNAKMHFHRLRRLQKTFEDLYDDWELYNLLGLALSYNDEIDRETTIRYFIENLKDKKKLRDFVKWKLVGSTMLDIGNKEKNRVRFEENLRNLESDLRDPDLYNGARKNQAYLQLLRMNVLDMNKRKFDFDVFNKKSLEHICPQNPNENNQEFKSSQNEINTKTDGINSIGNLVLLNGSTNSALSNYPLDRKKYLLFDKIKEGFLLPHTLKVFSKSYNPEGGEKDLFDTQKFWTSEDVIKNKAYFFNIFINYYGK